MFIASERVHLTSPIIDDLSESSAFRNSHLGSSSWEVSIDRISVHSRALMDGFYLMDMIKLNKSHGMHKDFMRRFRDILYVCDQEDKELVDNYFISIETD